MKFSRRLDRWVLATIVLSTMMFFIASGKVALGFVAIGLITLGYLSHTRRADSATNTKGSGLVLLLNALTLGVLGYAVVRVSGDRELLVESVGDLLAWALVIRVFDPRPGRRRGLLLLMSVFGALAAVLTSNAMFVGLLLIVYTPVAVWTIMLHQFAKGHETVVERLPRTPGLVVPVEAIRRLRSLSWKIAPVAVMVAGIVYVLMPRGVGADMLGEWDSQAAGATTGFTDRVMLQRSGQLVSSDEPVMDVVVTDTRGANIGSADRAVLLRGAVLEAYDPEAHAWVRSENWPHMGTRGSSLTPNEVSDVRDGSRLTTYRVTMRNKDTDYLFAPWRPVYVAIDRDMSLDIGARDLVLRAEDREGRMTYTVEAAPEWSPTRAGNHALRRLDIPESLMERAREILDAADLERDPELALTEQDGRIARAVEAYFQRNGTYDTTMVLAPTGSDPIEHFVLERMRGHCEQFASAMAAMLRGLGVSARVVTGFRAHEFNDIAGHYTVRQRDAHAWVEVRTGDGVWQTFDPSPSQDAMLGLGADRGVFGRVRQLYEAVEHLWVVYVVSFDEQMKRSLFERLGVDVEEMTRQARRGDTRMWRPNALGPRLLRAVGAGLIVFAGVAGLLYLTQVGWRLLAGRLRLPAWRFALVPKRRGRTVAAVEGAFGRAMAALERAGLERPSWRGALLHADEVESASPALAAPLRSLSRLHYAVRFGGRMISDAERVEAEAASREVERLAREHARAQRRGRRADG
ncbi:MAG: transglutaminase TgpA family protein [Phycisphaerales bacterium]